jgi:hypothetical protein
MCDTRRVLGRVIETLEVGDVRLDARLREIRWQGATRHCNDTLELAGLRKLTETLGAHEASGAQNRDGFLRHLGWRYS